MSAPIIAIPSAYTHDLVALSLPRATVDLTGNRSAQVMRHGDRYTLCISGDRSSVTHHLTAADADALLGALATVREVRA